MNKLARHAKRTIIGTAGGLIVLIGLVAIPYPGPGWLMVFAGLAILATEFDWAQHILDRVRGKYDQWRRWMSQQAPSIKFLFWLLTTIVAVVTIWLFNGYGLINDWLNIGWDWLRSPLLR
ncbi:MAG: TIGR02611 family protein [Candidatus Saccharimonadales bacterium]